MQIGPGTHLGPYHIVRLLGTGGMGRVFEARDMRLGRTVAIKVSRAEFTSRFQREARAIASLNHPNICTLHDVGPDFVVLELVEGETLAERIARGRLEAVDAVAVAVQIASALQAAHAHGIVHRDLKPANIKFTAAGALKVLDFGLAKLLDGGAGGDEPTGTLDLPTEAGTVVGTLAYMSPEQAQGGTVDARTDIWSLGVILHEMLTGALPFEADTAQRRVLAMLSQPMPRVPGASRKLQRVLDHCTEKDPARRYASATELLDDLHDVASRIPQSAAHSGVARVAQRLRRPRVAVPLSVLGLLALLAGGWLLHRRSIHQWVRASAVPQARMLAETGRFASAFDLANEAARYLPGDPAVAQLWPEVSRELEVRATPAGAQVSWRPYADPAAPWQALGVSPLTRVRLPKGPLRVRFALAGYLPLEIGTPVDDVDVVLVREGADRDGMVHIPAGPLRVNYPGLGDIDIARIDAFDIDVHEVTNRQFRQFIDAGGYRRPEFWTAPFVEDGRTLSWEAAMTRFVDATGRPGPSQWEAGGYADGAEEQPVAGVSWYEAAAYAVFAGKQLPSVYHWERAALPDESAHVIALSNFGTRHALGVGRSRAINRYGVADMAGNVREWCWNERAGQRFIQGGSWADPTYMFARGEAAPPFDRSNTNGFRCAMYEASAAFDPLRAPVTPKPLPAYLTGRPVADDVFDVYRNLYAYENTPLTPVVESADERSDLWRRERVRFKAAYGDEEVIAQLFLPKHAQPPFQCVVFFPSGDAIRPGSSDSIRPESYVLRSGRAMIYPVLVPTYERFKNVALTPVVIRDGAVSWRKDIGRALDYLRTRHDIDSGRIAYMGGSWGAEAGPIILALEPRFRVAVLLSGGLTPQLGVLPEVNAINFLPRVTMPVLMVNGQFDAILPVVEAQVPMFRQLGTPDADKRHILVDTGHWLAPEGRTAVIRAVLDWLDKYLGLPGQQRRP